MVECEHAGSREAYKFGNTPIYKCDDCGLIFNEKLNRDFDAESLYSDYYKNEIGSRFSFGFEHLVRLFRFFRAFKIFTSYPGAKSILDIGSGRGFKLYYLKKYFRIKRAVGIQISRPACEFSRERLGLEIIDKDFLNIEFGKEKFDIVTMMHVLEHVSSPEKYVNKIHTILNKGGRFIVEVPNFRSWSSRLTGKYWLGLDLRYHVSYFTRDSLERLLKKYNFKIKAVYTFSLEYSTFHSAQSLTSLFTKSRHVFFEYIQKPEFTLLLIPQTLLFFALAPFCFLINLLLYFSEKGEILYVVAEKDQN